MDFKCNRCGSKNYMIKKVCSQTGLYCSDCGNWYKWLNKNEIRVYSELNRTDESKENDNDFRCVINQLEDLVKCFERVINRIIDYELIKEPLSEKDSDRKRAYCNALESDKYALMTSMMLLRQRLEK